MPNYNYTAINAKGRSIKGEISAENVFPEYYPYIHDICQDSLCRKASWYRTPSVVVIWI